MLTSDGVLALSREVNSIVTTLIPLAQSTKVKRVIEAIVTAEFKVDAKDDKAEVANKALNEAIQRLDPLPETVGAELRTALEVRRGARVHADATPVDELARLSSLSMPTNPGALQARLNNIHAMLLELRTLEHKATKKGQPIRYSFPFILLLNTLKINILRNHRIWIFTVKCLLLHYNK